MSTRFKVLKEYFYPENKQITFVIPNYQRGYKWSVKLANEQTSVEYLMESLRVAYDSDSGQQFFLQGVTVVEDGDEIILIDGQQRTTTLYLLLWCLDRENIIGSNNINLDYTIRKKSCEFINNLKNESFDYNDIDREDKCQDIYYFKRAIEQINSVLEQKNIDRKKFAEFLLNKVSLLYIAIDREKAVRTFTMMNGQKAKMHQEELIKAEMLHIASYSDGVTNIPALRTLDDTFTVPKDVVSAEWETNALRSKYAREWDKWLYWWNQIEVKSFFNTHKPMGLLLEYYYKLENNEDAFSFRNFKKLLPDNDQGQTKKVFKALRDLQKEFEDIFNNPISYNYLKCALIGSNDDKYDVIMYFIENKRNKENLENYAKWRMLGSTHIEVTKEYSKDITAGGEEIDNSEKRKARAKEMIHNLAKAKVYNEYDNILYKQLLRLNVEEYNKLNEGKGVKFDFTVWNKKSLEHIYPKSKFFHIETLDDGQIKYVRGDGQEISEDVAANLLDSGKVFSDSEQFSEHCIGNLVLLYGRNNSEFGNIDFDVKKKKFFNNEISFESRNLLHTISAFASSKWDPSDIEEAAKKIIDTLAKDYNIDRNE